ncbi:MAG: hypothetical protein MR019_04320 [Ruminococcus sp.]|nr:hypothetical protein [Ruminococcus sp.]MDY3896204.1 hypothetical protein [Candidatus Fimenecus sp.]
MSDKRIESVQISIKPKWCELIAKGEKTVEVRKTKPKFKTPFKVYIYCTSVKSLNLQEYVNIHQATGGAVDDWSGKVIGEFICDYIYENMSYDCEGPCVSVSDLKKYANGKPLYGWHISDLVIYDKPKELSEFEKPCNHNCFVPCPHYRGKEYECEKPIITRPPQSWCYVEEVKE